MLKIAVIILNWQQPQLTLKTITSLLQISHRHFDYHIYLVDNGSADSSFDIFSKKYGSNSKITLLQTGANLGFTGGNNFGIRHALKQDYDYILLANNDIIVAPDFLDQLVKAALKEPKFAALGPKIYFAPGYEYHSDRYSSDQQGKVIWSAGGRMDWANVLGSNIGVDEVDRGQHDQLRTDVDFLTGCCLLLKTSALKQVGLLDESYFMYLEDVDLSIRLKQQGWQLAYVPQSKIWHVNSGSSAAGSTLHDYYITRNRLIFGLKYASLRAKLALVKESCRFLVSSPYPARRKAVIDFYTRRFGRGKF